MSGLGQTIYEERLEKGVEKTLKLLLSSGKISQSDAEKVSKAAKTDSLPSPNKN